MWTIRKTMVIDRPVKEVFGYASNPVNWYQFYVGLSEPENLEGNGEVGTTMNMKYTMLGVHLPITLEVTKNSREGNSCFWSGHIKGAVSSTQSWTYNAEGTGTEVNLDMEYELPGSVLGKVANKLVVKKLMDNSLEQTMNNLKDICETD
ncbi:putative membrane protein [Planomicrobium stackebrandtii]|uniref:Membrane protein n=1 Tax=Planomicrobium stackebrandtii TaxID=253160 RepID=A0ABU0GTN1_9BACL|nr:SRPBCC family protein [Planomicrobium stackebrandtii]MDQ0428653.1 putative membrane protein [Planomicrobium stackebrandtii]